MDKMKALIENFPQQLQKALRIGENATFKIKDRDIRNIVVIGMGGSGIGANLVYHCIKDQLSVPFNIVKDYQLPHYVNHHTLLIASSFSGNTEETLIALHEGEKRNALVACISSGGQLIEIAKSKAYSFIQIPDEAPCPRAFLGYSFIQLLFLLNQFQLIDDFFVTSIQQSITALSDSQNEIEQKAEDLAGKIYSKDPILYAEENLSAVLIRFQQQINENAKQLAHVNFLPEMNHNELVGWSLDKDQYHNKMVMVFHSDYENDRVKRRFAICEKVWEEKSENMVIIKAKGQSFLEQCLYLIHLTDWVSYYLALSNQVDPFPVDIIVHLKNELSKEPVI